MSITFPDLQTAIKKTNCPNKFNKSEKDALKTFLKENNALIYDYSFAFSAINSFLSSNSELTITIQGESYHNTKKHWCTLYLHEDFDPALIPIINRSIIHYYNKKIANYKSALITLIKESKLHIQTQLRVDDILSIFQTIDTDLIEKD